jgi:hypothetical protein
VAAVASLSLVHSSAATYILLCERGNSMSRVSLLGISHIDFRNPVDSVIRGNHDRSIRSRCHYLRSFRIYGLLFPGLYCDFCSIIIESWPH